MQEPSNLHSEKNLLSLNRNDPKTWLSITDLIRTFLVERGPDQGKDINFSLFQTKDSRKFSCEWFTRKLFNCQVLDRTWLIYSEERNALFCFCCVLFSTVLLTNPNVSSLANPKKGFDDWRHLSPRIPDHENSLFHKDNFIKWRTLEKNFRSKSCIDESLQVMIDKEKEKWRHILKVNISVILFCAENNLALRGSNEKINERDSVIFFKLC